jgi:hypothetical protein
VHARLSWLALSVEAEAAVGGVPLDARHELLDGLAPEVRDEPVRRLRPRGEHLDEAAAARDGQGLDEVLVGVVQVDGLRRQRHRLPLRPALGVRPVGPPALPLFFLAAPLAVGPHGVQLDE